MANSFWYPSPDDVLDIHGSIVSEYDDTAAGVQNRGDIEFALSYVEDGHFGNVPETIHEKSFHLLRLLVANHPFVDGNKRTALNTVTTFYLLNGHRFAYDDEIRAILKGFGTDEPPDEDRVIEYLRTHTEEVELSDVIDQYRDDLIRHGLDRLKDPND